MLHSRAAELFATAKDKAAGKPLENNTRLVLLDDGDYGIRLHNTIVVTIHVDGTYTLDSGNWKTVTTKDRINGYSPARLYQEKGDWYIGDRDFFDGIRVDADGKPLNRKAA